MNGISWIQDIHLPTFKSSLFQTTQASQTSEWHTLEGNRFCELNFTHLKDHWTLKTAYFEDPNPAIQVQTLPLESPRSLGHLPIFVTGNCPNLRGVVHHLNGDVSEQRLVEVELLQCGAGSQHSRRSKVAVAGLVNMCMWVFP